MKNKYKIDGDVLIVYNRKDDREILFDAEDFHLVNKHTWYIDTTQYARTEYKENNCRIRFHAHRFIMNPPSNMIIDHIDCNTLNNCKLNLRIVTKQINQHNTRKAKGYAWAKHAKKWRAYITVNYNAIDLGYYNTEDEARQAYLKAKAIYHPTAPIHLYK